MGRSSWIREVLISKRPRAQWTASRSRRKFTVGKNDAILGAPLTIELPSGDRRSDSLRQPPRGVGFRADARANAGKKYRFCSRKARQFTPEAGFRYRIRRAFGRPTPREFAHRKNCWQ